MSYHSLQRNGGRDGGGGRERGRYREGERKGEVWRDVHSTQGREKEMVMQ